MKAFLVVLAFAALFFVPVLVEWRTSENREGFWGGPLGILAEILCCFFRPF